MPLFRVVFKNGEKRTLDVEAGWIKETAESYIPKSRVLYIDELGEGE